MSKLFVVALCCSAALVGFTLCAWSKSTKAERRLDPSCFETHPDVDVSRTLFPVIQGPDHGRGGLYACGLYSRAAMPDVIRCYELNRGCSP